MSQPATSTTKSRLSGRIRIAPAVKRIRAYLGGRGGPRFVPATATPLSDVQSSAQFSCRSLVSMQSAAFVS